MPTENERKAELALGEEWLNRIQDTVKNRDKTPRAC